MTACLVQRKAVERQKLFTARRYLAGAASDALVAGNTARLDELRKTEIVRALRALLETR